MLKQEEPSRQGAITSK